MPRFRGAPRPGRRAHECPRPPLPLPGTEEGEPFGRPIRLRLTLADQGQSFVTGAVLPHLGLRWRAAYAYSRPDGSGSTAEDPASFARGAGGGADIVRVHDVRETVDALKIWNAINEE